MRRPLLPSAALIAILALAGGAAVASAATVRVDDDGKASAASCNATTKAPKTVQAGITAAGKNGTVIVCPGTYRGSVRIDGTRDGVTIQGAAGFTSKVLPPTAGLDGGAPLIWIKSSADSVTIKGLKVTTAADDCTVDELILVQGRGIRILGNQLTGGGCYNHGIVASSANGKAVSATIKNNTVARYLRSGIRGSDELTTLTVTGNTIRYSMDFSVSGAEPAGIVMEEHVNGSVKGNTIAKGTGTESPDHGIRASVGESLLIEGNTISGVGTGIWLTFVQLMTVTDNTITGTGTGILTSAFTNSTVQGNTISQHLYGIHSADNTFNPDGNNLFKGNVITQSSEYGCYELVGDEGLDPNVWTENSADSAYSVTSEAICPAG